MNDQKPKVLVIVGPTGSGKTSLSIALAKLFHGEVISADSRQVYRELDIGTEKVTIEEMDSIPHHLIDVVDVGTVYTAVDFAEAGQTAITAITENGNLPIIAGGTFFYVDTLLQKQSLPHVAPNPKLRAELALMSTEELLERLTTLDSRRAATIETKNPRRLMRAIEIAEALGSVPETTPLESPYDVLTLGIEVDRTILRGRLRSRAERAIERGLITETQALLAKGISKDRLNEIGLEYPLVVAHLDGELTMEELIQKLQEKNWQYAKRQWTWLKRDESINWVEPTDLTASEHIVRQWLSK